MPRTLYHGGELTDAQFQAIVEKAAANFSTSDEVIAIVNAMGPSIAQIFRDARKVFAEFERTQPGYASPRRAARRAHRKRAIKAR